MTSRIKTLCTICAFVLIWGRAEALAPRSVVPCEEAQVMAEQIAQSNQAWSLYRVSGESMDEYYGNHSLILVEQTTLRELRVGMLVLYRSPSGQLLAHQVVAHHGAWLRAKGASNVRPDPYFIKSDMIIGAVFGVLHTSGFPEQMGEGHPAQRLKVAYCKRF